MAPEIYPGGEKNVVGFRAGCRVDVYAFGALLAALCTRNRPYGDRAPPGRPDGEPWDVARWGRAVLEERLAPAVPAEARAPARLVALVDACCARDPRRRPSFVEVGRVLARLQTETAGTSRV
jgi:serine/threonine protein kinase